MALAGAWTKFKGFFEIGKVRIREVLDSIGERTSMGLARFLKQLLSANDYTVRTSISEYSYDIQRRIDLYHGRQTQHTLEQLKKVFNPKYVNILQQQIVIYNIVREVIDKVSRVYSFGAERNLVLDNGLTPSEDEQKLFDHILKTTDYENFMKTVNIYVNLCKTVFVRAYWSKAKQCVALALVTPEMVQVIPAVEDMTEIAAIMYLRPFADLSNATTVNPSEKYKYIYFDAEKYLETNGEITTQDLPNPYNVIPFQRFCAEKPVEGVRIDSGYEISNVQLSINVKLTFLNTLIKYQTFSIPKIVGNFNADEALQISPAQPIVLPTSADGVAPTFSFEKPTADIGTIRDEIEREVVAFCRGFGISESDFRLTGDASSGYAILLQNRTLWERRKNEKSFYEQNEEALFEIIKAVWNYHSQTSDLSTDNKFNGVLFRDETKLKVTIPDPVFPDSPEEDRSKWEWLFAQGLASKIDYFMRTEGMTETEAQDRLKQIEARRSEESPTLAGTYGGDKKMPKPEPAPKDEEDEQQDEEPEPEEEEEEEPEEEETA